ncbi:dynamin family protein [Paenibacillus qinlingensis]|uniref:dynamin family protein n=1 Tax=Paenibacillus qinlingensis TaxID=1837343 RepID=UPI0015630276|nr:dynamin family protein [Paenibacillus qinlingensis]NQX62593.1 dynamin family protein [Paenibacillus qinlingensis]
MITDYKQKRESVLNVFSSYTDIFEHLNELIPQNITYQAENIKNNKFILMVAGEAKSGKSTFINAYLGKEVLPMDVKQCTSAIIEIEYGETYELIAEYAQAPKKRLIKESEIIDFLTNHAALKDEYRAIPVAAINHELLIKYNGNPPKRIVEDLILGVKDDNLYNLSDNDYTKRIKNYIEENRSGWKNIVTNIQIKWPLDQPFKGITIIDSPGINAIGRVGQITEEYIEKANAIIFVKSLSGQALESSAFKKFLQTKSADKHKDTIYLVLTGASDKSELELNKLLSEAKNIYSEIPQKRIINVDSKLQLILNLCASKSEDDIDKYFDDAEKNGTLFPTAERHWLKSKCRKEAFVELMEQQSNFSRVNMALEEFARKAQYFALQELLLSISKSYIKIIEKLKENIDLNELKITDPKELERKIHQKNEEISEIRRKMNESIEIIINDYSDSKTGKIILEANKSIDEYNSQLSKISGKSMSELEKLSFNRIDELGNFKKTLGNEIIQKCNDELIKITAENEIIHPSFMEPDFSQGDFLALKNSTEGEAVTYRSIEEGATFKKTRTVSEYSKDMHFELVKDSIMKRLLIIKNDIINDLQDYTIEVTKIYKMKLRENADEKKAEYDNLLEKKVENDIIQKEIEAKKTSIELLVQNLNIITTLNGGIRSYVS